jgi:hypothetical protein
MDGVFVIKGKLQEMYAQHSIVFDKGVQFIVALLAFYQINNNVGFMKVAASPAVTFALSVICTFFPLIITVIAATALILVHMYAVSIGVVAVTAVVFLIMYIFYFRLTPKMALIVLLMPIAFVFHIPFAIPLSYALVSTPVSMVAVVCGTIVYYMMEYVKKAAPGLAGKGLSGIMTQSSDYLKKVFQNKEMWIIIAAFLIAFLVAYTIRRQSINHAWKAAVAAGAVVNVVVNIIGDIMLGSHISYASLITGSVVAIVAGFVLELMFFAVDYTKSESLQYEDDEYYYYVKAVPKLSVAKPEKTVKRINGRRETEIMDTEAVRNRRHDRERHGEREGARTSGRNASEHFKNSTRSR